jgi:polysaccharide biosynthesis protein PslH
MRNLMKRILILAPQSPYPPLQGTSLRNWHMLKALAASFEVSLLSFSESDSGISRAELLRAVSNPRSNLVKVGPLVPVPERSNLLRVWQTFTTSKPDLAMRLESETFAAELAYILREEKIDAVQIEGIELARYISRIKETSPRTPIVLDCHNAETELQRRAMATDGRQLKRWPAALYSWIQVRRLAKFEKYACLAADRVIAVSQSDSHHLAKLMGIHPDTIHVMPNTIDTSEYVSEELILPEYKFDLLFTGKMDYRPNVDGVLWFADEVWPLLKAHYPELTWGIVGQKSHPRLERIKKTPGIHLTGRVERVQPYLAGATLYIMPLRIGSGTRLKLIEAMSAGKAVVSTSIGAEGYPIQPDRDIVIADEPEEMARAIIKLLNKPDKRRELGIAAWQLAQAYDWRTMIPPIRQLYEDLLSSGI